MNTKLLGQLFLTFAKVGVMTFGGGMAMLPILQREVVEDKGWATDEELVDYFAIGQCTPGIIAVNTATFIGQKQAGIIGGIVATLGIVFPSLIIITALAGVINSFSHLAWVQHAFAGIRVCVCVLIFNAVVKLFKGSVKDWAAGLIFLAVLTAALLTDLSPAIFVAAAAALGIVSKFTPARSPQSNGMAEALVKTIKRDYVFCNDRSDAETVMAQLPGWFEDYNENAPHKALRMLSPREFIRSLQNLECPV